jgi:hypothetical protein
MRFSRAALVAVLAVIACSGRRERKSESSAPAVAEEAAASAKTDSSAEASTTQGDAFSPVTPADILPQVAEACDTLVAVVRRVVNVHVTRQDGSFDDSFQSTPRTGCRLVAVDTATSSDGTVIITDALPRALARGGWAPDLRFDADGPDGSDVGVRRRDVLCMIIVRSDGSDDDDTTTVVTPPSPATLIVECVHDVASNADAGVPDRLWQIATAAGLDSLYAIDVRLQYPPYLDGDFDGDGMDDAAVLVQRRTTGKLGVAFVLGGPRRVVVVAAGTPDATGADDLSWIDRWDRISRGVTYDLTNRVRFEEPPRTDVVWLTRGDSASAHIVWTGSGFRLVELGRSHIQRTRSRSFMRTFPFGR